MLNSYNVTPKVDAQTTNNLNFNAVSGTLCKSHPKSIFVWFQHGSALEKSLMGAEPKYRFDLEKHYYGSYPNRQWKYEHDEEPAVLLQLMLTGENRVLAEIIREADLYPTSEENDDGIRY